MDLQRRFGLELTRSQILAFRRHRTGLDERLPYGRRPLWRAAWPGALLADSEPAGTWRRAGHVLMIQPWHDLSKARRDAVEMEATSLPLPGIDRPMNNRWERG